MYDGGSYPLRVYYAREPLPPLNEKDAHWANDLLIAAGLPFIDPEGRLDVGDIYKQVAFWQSTGQVSRDADSKSFIDLSFVQGHFNVPK